MIPDQLVPEVRNYFANRFDRCRGRRNRNWYWAQMRNASRARLNQVLKALWSELKRSDVIPRVRARAKELINMLLQLKNNRQPAFGR